MSNVMTVILHVHPTHPQGRLLKQAVNAIRQGEVIVYPTDSGYALGCAIGEKNAIDKIRQIRKLDKNHNFTLLCRDFSEISIYARMDNPTFRFLKAHTPGAITFILNATKEVPKRLQHPKKKTIGIRIPQHQITLALLELLHEPLMSVSLSVSNKNYPVIEIDEMAKNLEKQVSLILDGGPCEINPTTIVDLTSGEPVVMRKGKGDLSV